MLKSNMDRIYYSYNNDIATENMLKVKPLRLCTYNTLQFKDYSRYEADMFSEEDKRAYHEANWDGLCDRAKQIGRKLIM